MLGNEEDFTAALGFEVEGLDEHHTKLDVEQLSEDDRVGVSGVSELQSCSHDLAQCKDGNDQ